MNEFLAELFASKVRAAVLGQTIPRPHLAWSLTEFSRILELPISSLQHECYKLERLGVLVSQREGASRRYRVNPDGPSIRELTALVVSALGPEEVLRGALEEIQGLESAFIATTLPLTQSAVSGADGSIPLVLIGEIPRVFGRLGWSGHRLPPGASAHEPESTRAARLAAARRSFDFAEDDGANGINR